MNENRWIPVNEQLPSVPSEEIYANNYLVALKGNCCSIVRIARFMSDGEFYDASICRKYNHVTHWMSLPQDTKRVEI